MDSFLSQYINSLGPVKSQTVVSVLQQAILGKADVGLLISQLQQLPKNTTLQLQEDSSQTFVSSGDFKSNIVSIDTLIQVASRIVDVLDISHKARIGSARNGSARHPTGYPASKAGIDSGR